MKSKPEILSEPVTSMKSVPDTFALDDLSSDELETILIDKQQKLLQKEKEISEHLTEYDANELYCSAIDKALSDISFSFGNYSSILKRNYVMPELYVIPTHSEKEKPTQKEVSDVQLGIKCKKQSNEKLRQQIDQQRMKILELEKQLNR